MNHEKCAISNALEYIVQGATQAVMGMWRWYGIMIVVSLCLVSTAYAGEWSGYIGGDVRLFPYEATSARQHDNYPGLVGEVEYHEQSQDGWSFSFVPFARIDQYDRERTHADIRELVWSWRGDRQTWRAGIGRVFWGVTEFYHLVDIVNQTDFVEDLDYEAKLGQPMISTSFEQKWGVLSAYVLPGFRIRTFPGPEGRLQLAPPIDPDRVSFESSKKRAHIDWALRWSVSGAGWDLGLSHFDGTSREPRFLPGLNSSGQFSLVPRYDLIKQTGLDAQTTLGNWLWKLEAITRSSDIEHFNAYTGGFEYTFVGVFGSRKDVGVIGELMRDGRSYRAPHFYQNDIGVGIRIGFNDTQSTQILFGVIVDRDFHSQLWKLEGNRRVGDKWKLSVEMRQFKNISVDDVVFGLRRDSYLQLGIARYL